MTEKKAVKKGKRQPKKADVVVPKELVVATGIVNSLQRVHRRHV